MGRIVKLSVLIFVLAGSWGCAWMGDVGSNNNAYRDPNGPHIDERTGQEIPTVMQ